MPLVTWPDVIGLRTVAGGGRLLRGRNFNPNDDGATWAKQAAGTCCERAASTVDGDVGTWPDEGGGRVLRGRWRHSHWQRGRQWLAR